MRALMLPAAALALAAAVVVVGGRMVDGPATTVVVEEPDLEAIAMAEEAVASVAASQQAAPAVAAPPAAQAPPETKEPEASQPADALQPGQGSASEAVAPAGRLAPSRLVAPAVVALPGSAVEELQREAPREPLSQLSLALPPPPPPESRNPWAGKPLFRPVAVESAVFESGGYTVAIDGVKSVSPDENCTHEGTSWPCGVRARAAFRLWLRGRALVCQIPDAEEAGDAMRARCRLAKEDVGAWLVSNGWALAAPDGPYVQAEEKARAEKLGIFGAPPDASSLSAVPDAPLSGAAESQPIMTEEGADPQPALDAGSLQEFPPAPPRP